MRYGSLEYAYAAPFADQLVADRAFLHWVLGKTRFGDEIEGVRLLHEDMLAARSARTETWWRSHYAARCRCQGCSGQETDVLVVCERPNGHRFALHIEVKQPTDRFPVAKDQATNYSLRASCWARAAPKSVLPHSDADTLLLCSAARLNDYEMHLPKFGSVLTFEDVRQHFPNATLC